MLDLEKALSDFSEATINFEIKDKVVKTGILKNWKTHPMFIEFFLERPNKKDDRYKVQTTVHPVQNNLHKHWEVCFHQKTTRNN